MTVDHRYQHLQVIRSTLATAIYPLQYLAHLPAALTESLDENLSRRESLIEENKRLREQALFNDVKLQRLALMEQENARLRKLLDSPAHLSNEKVLIAEILSVDLHPFRQLIVINKGTQQGVYAGQPLVGAKGIIGQVVEAFPLNSHVLLISDPNHALLAESNRTNLRAILAGSGQADLVYLKNVSPSADIRVGDMFHTSGLDGRFPPNYPIAEVTNITNVPGEPFMQVEAKPMVNLDTIREVLLLWTGTLESEPEIPPVDEQQAEPAEASS